MRRPNASASRRWPLIALAVLTVVAVAAAERLGPASPPADDLTADAARRMHQATLALADYRAVHGPPLDPEDVHRTGLIGTFFGPLTTTVGTVESKRTTTNPNMAALAVRLLRNAGVKRGDAIAVGASGSFPALLLAVLCAAEVLDLDVGLIVSFGSSQWGANLVGFTWLDVERILLDAGLLSLSCCADAVSFGGASDVGSDLDADVRDALRRLATDSDVPLIEEPNLRVNVARRMAVYREAVRGRPIAAFVNIGGAWANVGSGDTYLGLPPGVNRIETVPPADERGALFEFAAAGVPIVHLLHINALATAYGLPWDPSPLPAPREAADDALTWPIAVIAAAYVVCVGLCLALWRRTAGGGSLPIPGRRRKAC